VLTFALESLVSLMPTIYLLLAAALGFSSFLLLGSIAQTPYDRYVVLIPIMRRLLAVFLFLQGAIVCSLALAAGSDPFIKDFAVIRPYIVLCRLGMLVSLICFNGVLTLFVVPKPLWEAFKRKCYLLQILKRVETSKSKDAAPQARVPTGKRLDY
jgi:hypothetical protein